MNIQATDILMAICGFKRVDACDNNRSDLMADLAIAYHDGNEVELERCRKEIKKMHKGE